MDEVKSGSKSLYDYSDKSIAHAGYAALVYAGVILFGALLALIQFFIYHTSGRGGRIHQQSAAQQYVPHTPLTAGLSVSSAAFIVLLAVFIFRRSRFAVVTLLLFVIALQLYTWLGVHSLAGSIASVAVIAFLLRGAVRIFQDHAQHRSESTHPA
ncbi:MAG TPA: hypothetical protein VGL24_06005 [Chthoniobacterales bacterium]|jgi:hypothetical protein